MGYYTCHDIEAKNIKSVEEFTEIENVFIEKNIIGYAVCRGDYSNREAVWYCNQAVKWYEEPAQMKEISSMFPNVTFRVRGDGEEYNDYWYSYYKNGKNEFCKGEIVYPDPVSIKW